MSLAGFARDRSMTRFALCCSTVLLLIVASILIGCGEERQDAAAAVPRYEKLRPGRVFVIGIDGAAPRLVETLIAQGRLPNLEKLYLEGAFGTVRASKPITSPRIWNSIVTGRVPDEHGILHFSHKDEEGVHHLFLSTDRKVHTLWNIASSQGMKVGVVNFWNTFPPEKVDGVMVSDHLLAQEIAGLEELLGAQAAPAGSVIHPESWHERLIPMVSDASPLTTFTNPFAPDAILPTWAKRDELTRHFREDTALTRIGLEIEQGIDPDLFMILLPGIDRISHYLWGVFEPAKKYPAELQPSGRERRGGRDAVVSYYRYTDALIGLLLERATPEDLVIVLSDHGFEAGNALRFLTGVHDTEAAIDGVFFARGPGIAPRTRVSELSVVDVTPTILAWWGLPVAEDMDGRVAGFLETRPLARIPTWDLGEVETMETAESGVEADIVEQLRTLGYLEDEPTGQTPDAN